MSAVYSTQRRPVSSFWIVFTLGLMPTIHASIVNETCGSWDSDTVLCINSYGNVLPGNFSRQVSTSAAAEDTLASVSVPDDSTFPSINNATFLVFDSARSLEILGDSPTYELMFTTPAVNHEAPVYVPDLNHLYFTQVAQGVLTQALINLNPDTPTLEYVLADPPIYAPTGGQYHNGLIYWSTTGSNATEDGYVARPGIYTFDPKTNKSETLLNNYFGYFFNGADDIAIESNGDIWFTDDDYGWLDSTSINTPMLPTATYRFRPSTGAVQVVNTALSQPNGIRFSPSGDKLYLTDTGAVSGTLTGSIADISVTYSSTGPRVMYVFNVIKASNATDAPSTIVNGRPIYLSQDWVPDGLQVARNGWLVTATGHGVDVLDDTGVLLLRIQTPFKVGSINFAGDDLKDLWIVGAGYIARVKWELQGQELV